MKTVKVTKSSSPYYWYTYKIGQVFECYQCETQLQVKEKYNGVTCYILNEDCIPYDYISYNIKKLKLV